MTSVGEIVLIDSRCNSMIITWPEKSDAIRYCLEYRECTDNDEDSYDSDAEYENTYTFLSNKVTGIQISKRNLKPSTEYKFRVAACYSDGKQGSWVSHREPFSTLSEEDEEYSMAPPLVSQTADYNTLLITWEEIEDEEFYGFDLQMRECKGGAKWFQAFEDMIDGVCEITRGDLKSRKGYQFRVRPITEHEEPFSEPSDPVVPRLKQSYDGSAGKQQQQQAQQSQPQYYPKPQQKTKSSTNQEDYDNNDIEDDSWHYSNDGKREFYESPNQQAKQAVQRETQYGYQDPNAMPAPWFKSTGGNDQSVVVCWQPQDGTSAYELQMKELSTTHVAANELDAGWITIAAHFMNTQVKKKNLTSSYGYQFRVKPLDGYMADRGYSNPSNPIVLPTSSRTKKQNHQRAKAEYAPMPAPWFKGAGSGERNAIIVCWQPQSGSTSYELQMRENSSGEVWSTIASNLKCTEVKKKNLTSSNGYQFRIKPNDGPKKHRGFSTPSSTAIAN